MNHRFPLVLIGGLAMRSSEFEPLAEKIRNRNPHLTIFSFDNIAVGAGPRLSGGERLSIDAQADHTKTCLEKVLAPGTKARVFGLSMGGMIAACLGAKYPDLVHEVIVGASSPNLENLPWPGYLPTLG